MSIYAGVTRIINLNEKAVAMKNTVGAMRMHTSNTLSLKLRRFEKRVVNMLKIAIKKGITAHSFSVVSPLKKGGYPNAQRKEKNNSSAINSVATPSISSCRESWLLSMLKAKKMYSTAPADSIPSLRFHWSLCCARVLSGKYSSMDAAIKKIMIAKNIKGVCGFSAYVSNPVPDNAKKM
ncbi:MAG: hypothetical protein JST82_01300 [Bacteroidetes bacterium]|nr:hypothetical protein [Bacteroidota bacterium]